MEPLAPGTEDDTPIDYNSLTKKETENERLLKQKAILKNGQYENIFELSYVNGAEHWFCKVCECPIMGRVYQHELGRRHSMNFYMTNRHLDKKAPQNEESDEPEIKMDIAPGEPVPPGFEGEFNRQAQIQERLDGFKVGPLVALEYLIEMQDYDLSKEPLYLCILCDKRGDPRTVLTHLASYNHISQYLQKHFPTCYRALAPYMTKQYKRNWQMILQKIAEAIETKFGRLMPFCIEKDKFETDRLQYLTMISKGKHFSEQLGPTFLELVVHEELTKTYEEELAASKPSSFGGKPFIEKAFHKRSPSPPVVNRPTKKPKVPNAEQPKQGEKQNQSKKPAPRPALPGTRRRSLSSVSSLSSDGEEFEGNRRGGKTTRNKSPPSRGNPRDTGRRFPYDKERAFRRRSPSPPPRKQWERERDFRRPAKDAEEQRQKNREKERLEKLEEYKKLSKAIENDMEKTLKNHEKNPEKHPKYNDEWKLFWNRRYKELQTEGKDASKYDFKPEWIQFWGKKMLEIHQEELKNRKDGLRRRLGLPEEPSPVCFRIGGSGPAPTPKPATNTKAPPAKDTNKPNMPMAARPDNDPEIIIIDDREDDKKKTSSGGYAHRARSHSPWERESPPIKSNPRMNQIKEKRPVHSPLPQKTRSIERPKDLPRRSRERSIEKRRSLEKRRSMERRRSTERRRSRSRELAPRKSRDSSLRKSPGRDRRSRSRDSFKVSRNYSRDGDRGRYSRDRSWDRVRESSFERDIRGRERIRTVADLPWEREKAMYPRPHPDYDDYYGPPHMMRDVSRTPMVLPPPIVPLPEDDDDNEEVNIVSVLRLLTAVEEKLGSLGPKVIDLLAQALALEKKEANSSETLMDNEINCVMFETVKEKLKGQLLAGLVDMIQERAFKKAIQKTANLIHIAGQRKRQRDQLKPPEVAVAVPGVGAVDKAAIARQLANALVAQGKTDVTQAELEQLINAVVGMAEASKNSNKPMTTACFLEQLTGGRITRKESPEPPKEKIIIARVRPEGKREKSRDKDLISELDKLTEPLSPETPEKSSTSNMENLSDSDLQTLLQNFKDLSTDEQMNLINYLKKLELDEPERVERLRKFVNLGSNKGVDVIDLDKEDHETNRNGRESPFSNRVDGVNPDPDDFEERRKDDRPVRIHLDSEDEDYSYEDVVKAASKNIKQKEMEDNRKIVEDSIGFDSAKKEVDLTDAKALISNLMSSFSKNTASSGINLLSMSGASNSTQAHSKSTTTPTSSAEFAKTLSNINVANLASIVSSVQSFNTLTSSQITEAKNMSPFENFDRTSGSPMDSRGSTLGSNLRLPNPLASQGSEGPNRVPIGSGPRTPGPNQGLLGLNPGPRGPNLGPRGPSQGIRPQGLSGSGQVGPRPLIQYPQRAPGPNLFGNSYTPNSFGNQNVSYPNVRQQRPIFNSSFANPRYGGPRGQGGTFNNRW